jgi:hypothetical protein
VATGSTYGRHGRCIQGFGGGGVEEREHSEEKRVDGRIILKCNGRTVIGGCGLYLFGSG